MKKKWNGHYESHGTKIWFGDTACSVRGPEGRKAMWYEAHEAYSYVSNNPKPHPE